MDFVFTVVVLAFVIFFAATQNIRGKEANKAWQAAARKLRLEYKPAVFFRRRRLSGTLQGFRVTGEASAFF